MLCLKHKKKYSLVITDVMLESSSNKDNNDHGLRFETKKNGCNYRDGADNLFSRVEAQLDEISYVGVSLGCCPLAGQAELFYPGL